MKAKMPQSEVFTFKGQVMKLYASTREKNGKKYSTYTLAYIGDGRRQRKSFSTREDAIQSAKEIAEQLSQGGLAHVSALSGSQLADASTALKALRVKSKVTLSQAVAEWLQAQEAVEGTGTSIVAACEQWRKRHEDESSLIPASVPEVFKAFMEHLETNGASERYISDCNSRLSRFASSFQCPIHSVRTQEIVRWIKGRKVSLRTQKNFKTTISTLFSFARSSGYLPRDKRTEAESIPSTSRLKTSRKTTTIEIYSPEEMKAILEAAPPHVGAMIAIAGFCGLRSIEVFRLQWKDIRTDSIIIEAENAKTGSRRIIPLLPCASAWIGRLKRGKDDTPLHGWSHAGEFSTMTTQAIVKAGVKRKGNALRHSFASYRLAGVEDVAKVALEMGNSPQMIFQHYRELVTKSDAEAWFNIMPESPKNIIRMPRKKKVA